MRLLRQRPALGKMANVSVVGALRVLALLSVVSLVLVAWSLRTALADADLAVQRLTDSLSAELGPGLIGTPETLSINGQTLLVSARSAELSVHDALARFEQHCVGEGDSSASGAMLPEALLAPLPHEPLPKPEEQQVSGLLAHLSVLRREADDEGRLLCFARGRGRRDLGALMHDLRLVAERGDLSQLGKLRYVTARKLKSGKTQLVVVWAEGPLELGALLPRTGDAPGSDMHDVPRPAGTTRDLCALAVGHAYGLRLYRAKESSAQLLAFYDSELPKRGWSKVPVLPTGGDLGQGLTARAFVRRGHALAIGVQTHGERAEAQLSVIDLGGRERTIGISRASLLP